MKKILVQNKMHKIVITNFVWIGWILVLLTICSNVSGEASEISRIFGSCHKSSTDFDSCIKNGFNKLRPFFKTGQRESVILVV